MGVSVQVCVCVCEYGYVCVGGGFFIYFSLCHTGAHPAIHPHAPALAPSDPKLTEVKYVLTSFLS